MVNQLHQTTFFPTLVSLVTLLAACGGGSGSSDNGNVNDNVNVNVNVNCTDTCGALGESQCANDWVEHCAEGVNGCLEWQPYTDCTQSGQICEMSAGAADCTGACVNACNTAGDTQCLGSVIQTCEEGTSGCLVWNSGTDCADALEQCDDSQEPANCLLDCTLSGPDAPSGPLPADGNGAVLSNLSTLNWSGATGAVRYAVYWGESCPPPSYPDASFEETVLSNLSGVNFVEDTTYCWQVVSIDANDCFTAGPVWSFSTICADPSSGPPLVTSTGQSLPANTTAGSYSLTFSEPVNDVLTNLVWTPIVGTGTMGTPTQLSPQSYSVPFSGVAEGDSYTLTVSNGVTDACGNAMSGPVDITITIEPATGETCTSAYDVTSETFPFHVTGSFTDDPAVGSHCDSIPTNAIWYRYTPAVSGEYQIMARNHIATTANARLAVFEANGCSAVQDERACLNTLGKIVILETYMNQGMEYYILFHTDSDSNGMQDPELTITGSSATVGEYCEVAEDLSTATMPHTAQGTYEAAHYLYSSCGAYAANAYWFTYTPTTTEWHDIYVINAANDNAKLVIYQGASCQQPGTELFCLDTDGSGFLHLEPTLTAGVTYTFVYFTTSELDQIIDPVVIVQPWQPQLGEACSTAAPPDSSHSTCVSGVCTLIYTSWQNGFDFPYEVPSTGSSCLATPYNIRWARYTAIHDGWMQLYAHNNALATGTNGLAVFEGTSCAPYGPEALCKVENDGHVRGWFYATTGVEYLIMFSTDDDANPMSTPKIYLYPNEVRQSGFDCANVSTSSSDNATGWGWAWDYDPFLSTSEHTFTCDSAVGGGVVAEYTTGASQTTLNYSVNISDYETGGAIAFEIADGPCLGGGSLLCLTGQTSRSGQIFVMPNTTYYIHIADSVEGNRLPSISVSLW